MHVVRASERESRIYPAFSITSIFAYVLKLISSIGGQVPFVIVVVYLRILRQIYSANYLQIGPIRIADK
jgi:hypothetical protein